MEARENEALVVFVRPAFMGKVIKFKVSADGTPIGWTRGKQYFFKYFQPGPVSFLSKAENKAEIKIDLKAGKTYYIKQDISMGFLKARNKLKLLSVAEGEKAVAKCKLSKCMEETSLV